MGRKKAAAIWKIIRTHAILPHALRRAVLLDRSLVIFNGRINICERRLDRRACARDPLQLFLKRAQRFRALLR